MTRVRFTPDMAKPAREGAPRDPAPLDAGLDDFDAPVAEPAAVAGECPVRFLGMRHGVYYAITPAGELRAIKARDLRSAGLDDLFNPHQGWLVRAWPTWPPKANPDKEPPSGYSEDKARRYVMRECARIGLFDSDTAVRQRGVWKDGDGNLVVNCGDVMLWYRWRRPEEGDGVGGGEGGPDQAQGTVTQLPPGPMQDGALYVSAPRIARPAVSASVSDAEYLLHRLGFWNFKHPRGAQVALGGIAVSMLGGAPGWRPHLLVQGERGSGKSTLAALFSAAMGGGAHDLRTRYTEAGLRQWLSGEARTMVLDEAEGDSGRAQKIIELIRHMSSGAGMSSVVGSSGGTHTNQTVTGNAVLFTILPPVLLPSDVSRFTVLDLAKADGATKDAADAAAGDIRPLSAALRGRMIAGWPDFQASKRTWHQALLDAGCDARGADQLASILAGRDTMLRDSPTDPAAAAAEAGAFLDLVQAREELEEESDAMECLAELQGAPVDHWQGGQRATLGQLVTRSLTEEGTEADRKALQVYGLDVSSEVPRKWVLVANKHRGLEQVFRDTRWSGGRWRIALARLAGVEVWTGGGDRSKARRFAGVLSRCQAVPRGYWLEEGSPAAYRAPPVDDGDAGLG